MLRNDGGNRKHWLSINTVGKQSNRDGIGCGVKVVSASGLTQYFTVNTAAGYLSASDKRLLVGLGADYDGSLGGDSLAVRRRADVSGTSRRGRRWSRPRVSRDSNRGARVLALPCASARGTAGRSAFAQGISSRGVRPQPRGKPSGRPFAARFTDVAAQAGLTHPTVYGGVDAKRYIIEVVGCGVAFVDYDNDGWLDVLVLSGTRLDGCPARHDHAPLQEQSRRHLHRRHGESGPDPRVVGIGGHRRRLRQ